jgi:hypothetical protein
MSVVIGYPFAIILGSTLISSLAFYIDADDSILSAGRVYSDIDIRLLTTIGSLATAFFLGRLFGVVIAFFLRVIGYSVRLIPELETDRASCEDSVDDRLSDYDLVTTNC